PASVEEQAGNEIILHRHLHAVRSELGALDKAVEFEQSKSAPFTYIASPESSCLVECDEEPPHKINADALFAALEVCAALGSKVMDEIWVMRKTVIDGSNTSGFQRTAIVGLGGSIETSKGKVGIQSVCLEEESAGIVSDAESGSRQFRLDRLGIPLIEIATDPDIVDFEHAKEVSYKIGMLLRMNKAVMRGIGTIRQDLNVSIEGGARVEIKGAQELDLVPKYVQNEVVRQYSLLSVIEKLHALFPDGKIAPGPATDLTDALKGTECKIIRRALDSGGAVYGARLPRHNGILGIEVNPNRRYGSEISDYAKQSGVKGMIHSDEDLKKYSLSPSDVNAIIHALHINNTDAFIMVADERSKCQQAIEFACARVKILAVPEETRKANPDGTSSFMRPLPTSARMYPETDVPPFRVTASLLSQAGKGAREGTPESVLARLKSALNEELALKIFRSEHLRLFEELVAKGHDPMVAAVTLEDTLVSLRREGVLVTDVPKCVISALDSYKEGKIAKSAIPDLIREIAKGADTQSAIVSSGLEKITGKNLESVIIAEKFDMGQIMKKYRLNIEFAELEAVMKNLKG
ncbi:MAG TPA: Glu-tRNA(Gln) amidotransferase subunit GatE, partial [Candidatus Micrarchaeota archaeon]|nr:Glu-tRNA(Gln) amidotransferase subunit GatE [Candidatus Micrarchaeota archaeon]